MKTLLILLAGLTPVLLAGTSPAQENLLGLFADDQATINELSDASGQLNLFLVTINPSNQGSYVENIQGFEARIEFQESSDFVMDASFPVNSVNIGTPVNMIVGYGEPVPVQGQATVLATVVVYTSGNPESNIFLQPTDQPSIPGYMALLDANDIDNPETGGVVPLEPTSRDFSKPVFLINSAGLEQKANWGTAKSLFR